MSASSFAASTSRPAPPAIPDPLPGGEPPPRPLAYLCSALLAKQRDRRPAGAGPVATILEAVARGESVDAAAVLEEAAALRAPRGADVDTGGGPSAS